MKYLRLLILISFASYPRAWAAEPEVIESSPFTAERWIRGLHLIAGVGVNTAYYDSPVTDQQFGAGFNVYTGVDYYFYERFALEVNTDVMLDRIKNVLIWDTMMSIGMRVRLTPSLGPEGSVPYFRFFGGKGPVVFSASGKKPKDFNLDGDRTQVEGDVYGLGYGIFQEASDHTTWFFEVAGRVHYYRKLESIVEVEKVPEIIASRNVKSPSASYSLTLTFGVVVF